jgi:hypothetical protein
MSGDKSPHAEAILAPLQNKLLSVAALILSIVAVSLIVISANKTNPTASESLMLGTLISFFSIVVAVLVSHIYYNLSSQSAADDAKKAYDEKIQTFARKAAEKVFNLSNEFDRLAESVKSALDESEDEEKTKTNLIVFREKMLSVVHVLETLKSMNDTSLSDWRGIIGDDINLQRHLQREITDQLEEQRKLIESLESRVKGDGGREAAEERLQVIEQRLFEKIAALPFGFRPLRLRPKKQQLEIECPRCQFANKVRARPTNGTRKLFLCSSCGHYVQAVFVDDGAYAAEMAKEVPMAVNCPVCKTPINFTIPEVIGATLAPKCSECGTVINAYCNKDGIQYKSLNNKDLGDKFLSLVLANIPPHPWPQGMHKDVAAKMGVSNGTIDRAIQLLIQRNLLQPNNRSLPSESASKAVQSTALEPPPVNGGGSRVPPI